MPKKTKSPLDKFRADLVLEWHKSKNKNLLPNQFSIFLHKKVSWQCYKNKE